MTRYADLMEENADLISFKDVVSFQTDIREDRDEIKRQNAEGEMVSYNPPRYKYQYDFKVSIQVSSPYFDDIDIQLNRSSIELESEMDFRRSTSWYSFYSGKGESIDLDTEEDLRAVYDETATYVEGVEAFLNATAELYSGANDTAGEVAPVADEWLILDEADLLSVSDEIALNEKLNKVSHDYNAQLSVVTIEALESGTIEEYLESVYDNLGYGYGENHDGVMLMVCMNPREYRILSNGFAGEAITTDDIEIIGNAIVSDLSDGNYIRAFDEFANQCDYYLNGYLNGYPFNFGFTFLICLAVGLIAGLIVSAVLKGQLKTVRKQEQAADYVKAGSLQVTVHNDIFLYSDVRKTEKESESSSSGSGSSGSGSSRSIGGGSF